MSALCQCSKCGKEYVGYGIETVGDACKWRSPCCNARGTNWKIMSWVKWGVMA